jgi:hypothetical protein
VPHLTQSVALVVPSALARLGLLGGFPILPALNHERPHQTEQRTAKPPNPHIMAFEK